MGKVTKRFINDNTLQDFAGFMKSFGTNWRMLEVQAVIGRIQLKRMSEWNRLRREHAAKIDEAVAGFKVVRRLNVPSHIVHGEYKHYLFLVPENLKQGWTQDKIIEEINTQSVPCYHGSCSEIYLEKAFEGTNWIPKERMKKCQIPGRN